jgi:hypothetical protein
MDLSARRKGVDTRDGRDLAAAITGACQRHQQRSGLAWSTAFPDDLRGVEPARSAALCQALTHALDEMTQRWAVQRAHVEVADVAEPAVLRLTITGEPEALPGADQGDCVLHMRRCLRRWDGNAELRMLPLGLLSIRAWMPVFR